MISVQLSIATHIRTYTCRSMQKERSSPCMASLDSAVMQFMMKKFGVMLLKGEAIGRESLRERED